MMKLYTCLAITWAVSIPWSLFAQELVKSTIVHDSFERVYYSYVPSSYSSSSHPLPLVFIFHGYTNTAGQIASNSRFASIAEDEDFIVVFPQGMKDALGKTHWNIGNVHIGDWVLNSFVDDVGFIRALLESIKLDYNIDSKRIYSAGFSNGGYMSLLLACQLNEEFAAVAAVAGLMTPDMYEACNPAHPTPVLLIHGDNDDIIPYLGSSGTKSADEVIEFWAGFNNCDSTPINIGVPNRNLDDGSTVEHLTFSNCENGSSVEHFKVIGGGHQWPGAYGNMDIDASEEIWNFFCQYTIEGLDVSKEVVLGISHLDSDFTLFPNPTFSSINITGNLHEPLEYELINLSGQHLLSGRFGSGDKSIDLNGLPTGMYLLIIGGSLYKIQKSGL